MFSASTINVTIKAAPHPAACWSAKGELVEYYVIRTGRFAVGPVK